jgi:pyruvate/2-oxoglutarate/acetoin dehydrogenase E1 component
MEQKKLYRSLRGPVPEELYEVPLGQAALRRQGKDLSVIGYGSILVWAQPLIDQLVSEGIDVEVLDLRTLVPLDYEAIAQTVRKTGRVLLAHEAVKFGGFSGEISAFLAEECFDDLAAPVRRIGSRSTPIPTNPVLEEHYWPQKNEFLEAARNLMTY